MFGALVDGSAWSGAMALKYSVQNLRHTDSFDPFRNSVIIQASSATDFLRLAGGESWDSVSE